MPTNQTFVHVKCLKELKKDIYNLRAEGVKKDWYKGYTQACDDILEVVQIKLEAVTIRENNGQERTEGEAIQ